MLPITCLLDSDEGEGYGEGQGYGEGEDDLELERNQINRKQLLYIICRCVDRENDYNGTLNNMDDTRSCVIGC